jgi:hypothetical protein
MRGEGVLVVSVAGVGPCCAGFPSFSSPLDNRDARPWDFIPRFHSHHQPLPLRLKQTKKTNR